MENTLKVSVVICTYNRAELLKDALQALLNQTADKSLYEVIIVNNNSTDNTGEIAEDFVKKYKNFTTVVEKKQGISNARNLGYKEVNTHCVAYLDDDIRVRENYIERILYVIDNYDFDCFGGVYNPWYKYGRPSWFKDEYETKNYKTLPSIGEVPNNLYLGGGNLILKRAVLEEVGGFYPDLGMKGDKIYYGEENFLQRQLRKINKKIGFDPELIVDHAIVEKKMHVSWFLKSAWMKGKCYWVTFEVKPTFFNVMSSLHRPLYDLLRQLPEALINLFRSDYYIENFIIDVFEIPAGKVSKIIEGFRLLLRSLFRENEYI
ncbi:MAG TPA: glycosyltransferase family 2 protein [Candidatus Eremiobacteraeota bacterium]|nr:MAG: putative glycosyltransferase EpsH [bacterium ADurb.Bin363]HPZ07617.1 glycosyltransferase family 2 protein [Candidatus Eremiobacteraeota bacterium]